MFEFGVLGEDKSSLSGRKSLLSVCLTLSKGLLVVVIMKHGCGSQTKLRVSWLVILMITFWLYLESVKISLRGLF